MRLSVGIAMLATVIALAGCTGQQTEADTLDRWDAKAALVAEYDPGSCTGMPTYVREETINETIARHPDLVSFLQRQYSYNTSSRSGRRDLYDHIQQFGQINLDRSDRGFDYRVDDGRCCVIRTYWGQIVQKDGLTIDETRNTTERVPC